MSNLFVFVKNAAANLLRGGATALVAILLPPLLVRHMTPSDYAVWVLVLQVGAYVAYLDFGLQTAVGRYVAYANEKNDLAQRNSVFSTAFAALFAACILSVMLLLVAIAAVRIIFPGIPAGSVPVMRWGMLILGTALALGLPASAWSGVFIGLQRYEIPAMVIGGARLLSAVGVVAAAFAGKSVVVMASIMAITYLGSYGVQYLAMQRVVPDIQFDLALVRRATASELFSYCFGLTVMSFSMLLVTGFDLILVGRFQFNAVTPYSVAASLITFVAGLLYAILNVMMPHAAALHARQDPAALGRLVIGSTRFAVLLLVFTGIPPLVYAGPILKMWIGQQFVAAGRPVLATLLLANMVRLIGAPYAIVLVSAGQQRLIKVSPVTEGVSNLAASVVLGAAMGAIGVALGTLIGSFFSIGAHLFYSMPRTYPEIRFARQEYLWSGIALPLLCSTPLLVVAAASLLGSGLIAGRPLVFLLAYALSLAAGLVLMRKSGLLRRSHVASGAATN